MPDSSHSERTLPPLPADAPHPTQPGDLAVPHPSEGTIIQPHPSAAAIDAEETFRVEQARKSLRASASDRGTPQAASSTARAAARTTT